MKKHQVFTSLKSFKRFLQSEVPPGTEGPFYGRIIGKNLAISTNRDNPGWYPDSPPVRYFPLELPAPSQARQWWKDLLDGEIADYRICDELWGYSIACLAKSAIWSSLPDVHMLGPKHEFRICSEQEFLKIVGEELFDQMIGECEVGGISFRRVILEADIPRRVAVKLDRSLVSQQRRRRSPTRPMPSASGK